MKLAGLTLAYWCVIVAALLPMVSAWIAKSGSFSRPPRQGGFDNHNPRAWLARQEEWRARANAAQANGFEQLPFFIGAVIIAHQLGRAQPVLDLLALAYVLLRCGYIAAYVKDFPTLRSLIWTAALFVNVAILFAGAR
ncbi:MAG: MAPEG family protein [Burkholderiales bacterium]